MSDTPRTTAQTRENAKLKESNQKRSRARQRAYAALQNLYPHTFRVLYEKELKKEGL